MDNVQCIADWLATYKSFSNPALDDVYETSMHLTHEINEEAGSLRKSDDIQKNWASPKSVLQGIASPGRSDQNSNQNSAHNSLDKVKEESSNAESSSELVSSSDDEYAPSKKRSYELISSSDEDHPQSTKKSAGIISSDEESPATKKRPKMNVKGDMTQKAKKNMMRKCGGRIYDSVLGETCHWCRQKTVEDHTRCCRSPCTIKFCGGCLRNRNGEEILDEMQVEWVCPKCRGGCGTGCENCCNCGPCRKAQGLGPTGPLVYQARAAGFTNVHDYLVSQSSGESAEALTQRKEGKKWTKAGGAALLSNPPKPMKKVQHQTSDPVHIQVNKWNVQRKMRGSLHPTARRTLFLNQLEQEKVKATGNSQSSISSEREQCIPKTVCPQTKLERAEHVESAETRDFPNTECQFPTVQCEVDSKAVCLQTKLGPESLESSDQVSVPRLSMTVKSEKDEAETEDSATYQNVQVNSAGFERDLDSATKFIVQNEGGTEFIEGKAVQQLEAIDNDPLTNYETENVAKETSKDDNRVSDYVHLLRPVDLSIFYDANENINKQPEVRKTLGYNRRGKIKNYGHLLRPMDCSSDKADYKLVHEKSMASDFHNLGYQEDKTSLEFWPGTTEVSFTAKLKWTLDQQFDMSELADLWNQIRHRKPIVRVRETRHRSMNIQTGVEGLSYLDHHPDLAKMLKACIGPEEKLKLLRGFFFWLKYACMAGSFKPWLSTVKDSQDADCYEIDGPDLEVTAVVISIDDYQDSKSPAQEEDVKPSKKELQQALSGFKIQVKAEPQT